MKQLLIILISVICNCNAQLIIKTSNGKVQGNTNSEKTVRIFKGIPFAAPPFGDFRWKAPQPTKNWKGVKNCTQFSASPIQNKPEPFYGWSAEFIAKPEPLSEDCLYLNVWSSATKKEAKQPVFVWIYGGGLSSGSANCDIYNGEQMAKQGIIFVSLNYRVGVLGFMAHPELTKESGVGASGNYGFLDQIAALKWVQKNIAAFGGDPANVTIAGQSAGAFSVAALIASPLAKAMFHKAITQSGGLLGNNMLSQNLAAGEAQGVKVMQKANVPSLAELRKVPASELQKLSNDPKIGRYGTISDNYVLSENLNEYFKNGLHNQVPILAGWVTGDGSFLGNTNPSVDEYKAGATKKYGDKAEQYLSIFPANTTEEVKIMNQRQTLLGFAGIPAYLLAMYNPKPTYLYQFSHVPTDKPNFPNYGAFHTSEVPFALHTLHLWDRPWQQADLDVQRTISSYWVNFVKTGNPNGSDLPEWKAYDNVSASIMEINSKSALKPGLYKREFEFLTSQK